MKHPTTLRHGHIDLTPRRDRALAYLLWMGGFFGVCGLHRIYMGRVWSGLLYVCTGGLCFIGQFVDLFMMSRMLRDSTEGHGW